MWLLVERLFAKNTGEIGDVLYVLLSKLEIKFLLFDNNVLGQQILNIYYLVTFILF